MCRKQSIAHLAHGSVASAQAGHVVCGGAGARMRIGNRKSQAHFPQQGNIRGVIANKCALRGCHPELHGQGAKVAQLVSTTLDYVADAELPTATGDGRRAASGNDGDADAGLRQALQAMAVFDIERLQRLAARAVIQAAIGEHPVNIQYQQANRGRG
jgi:hypothetical protein